MKSDAGHKRSALHQWDVTLQFYLAQRSKISITVLCSSACFLNLRTFYDYEFVMLQPNRWQCSKQFKRHLKWYLGGRIPPSWGNGIDNYPHGISGHSWHWHVRILIWSMGHSTTPDYCFSWICLLTVPKGGNLEKASRKFNQAFLDQPWRTNEVRMWVVMS